MNQPALTRFFLLSALVASGALAQSVPDNSVEQWWIDPAGRGSELVGNGQVLKQLEFRIGAAGFFTHSNLTLRNTDFLSNRLGVQVFGALGITDWLEIGANVPVLAYQDGRAANLASAGLGNPWVQLRAGILNESKPVALSVGLGVGIPVGTGPAFGNGGLEVMPRLNFGKTYEEWQWGVELGYLHRAAVSLVPVSGVPGDVLGSQVFGAVTVTSVSPKGPRGEASARVFAPVAGGHAGVELQIGGRIPVGPVEFFGSAGPGLWGDPSTPSVRAYLGLAFANAPLAQPLCAEARPYPVADCPDLDKDGDGVKNGADKCPTEAGPAANAGCPDVDTDKDGLVDRLDKCPKEAGPTANAGCPDVDTDQDGVVDRLDKCPAQAGVADNAGCPEPDADADGIPDGKDACPKEAGPAATKGCPLKDTDGDGVTDNEDNCPTVKGVKENAGCPANQKQLVTITADKIQILDKVYFDTGRSTIQARSLVLLDNVAAVLNGHPEIKAVEVQGHTDNQGVPANNKALSQARAEAVKAYLVKKGVDAARLTAVGYGQEKPIQTNDTPAGRDANRRVEFALPQAK